MNVNINLRPKKGLFKKIIIIILFSFLCFFIKENVFAMDLEGNNSNEQMPPFLKNLYDVNTKSSSHKAICDDETASYCNLYNYLEQFFSEFHSLYKNVVVVEQYYSRSLSSGFAVSIYFFLDTPYINSGDNSYTKDLNFKDFNGKNLRYYRINLKGDGVYRKDAIKSITIDYFYGSETDSEKLYNIDNISKISSLYTNFNLYAQDHSFLVHVSDVQNWTYQKLKGKSGLMLIPKKNTIFASAFSYNKENIFISWYDIKKKNNIGYLPLDPPVTGTLSYYINYNSDRLGNYYFIIANKGINTSEIAFISEDFDIVVFEDTYNPSIGSNGSSYDNPLGDLFDDIDNDKIFSTDKSILDNIVSFFSHFWDYLMNLGSRIIDGVGGFISNLLTGISDFLKQLFIPDKEIFEDFINQEYEFLKGKLGFLSYPIDFLSNFINRFNLLSNNQNAVFNIPEVSFLGITIFHSTSFDLLDLVNSSEPLKYLYSLYQIFISGLIVLWLIELAIKKYNELFGGGH